MFSRSSWLHLRFQFSFLLLPIFLLSLLISPNFSGGRILWVFLILHFLLYPASNGYNSYFDKDEKSIGGLEKPPPVNRGLYFFSLGLDVVAVILSILKLNATFTIMIIVYGLVSKAYSHPSVRLKKYPWLSWLITGLFQGLFTLMMSYAGVNNYDFPEILKADVLMSGLLASLMLWANYPLTQIYQHEEDARRGDLTLSRKLGILGTFYFVASFFTIAAAGFLFFFKYRYGNDYAWFFLLALLPVLFYFFYWFLLVVKDRMKADYRHTMNMVFIAAAALNVFFIYCFLDYTQVLQVI